MSDFLILGLLLRELLLFRVTVLGTVGPSTFSFSFSFPLGNFGTFGTFRFGEMSALVRPSERS